MDNMETPLSLNTLCGGDLEKQFLKMYPALLSQCKAGEKASVAITIEFERVPDTSSMVKTKYKITPRFPATSKASLCQFDDNFNVKTEEPPKTNVTQIKLVEVVGNE